MKNIICGIDDKYYRHCGAMLLSLFSHDSDTFQVYVLTLGLTDAHKGLLTELVESRGNRIRFIGIGKELIENFPMKKSDYPSLATYLRLFIPRVLPPEVEKALYADSDIIFNGNIAQLYETDLTDYAAAAMEDAPNRHPERLGYPAGDSYFNAGLLLLNLKMLREMNFVEKALDYIRENHRKIVLHDQDVLNALLHGRVQFIPIKWNMLDCFYKTPPFIAEKYKAELAACSNATPPVIHFSGPLKPWHHGCPHPLKNIYFDYSSQLSWGCRHKEYGAVFSVFRFPANLLVCLGTPQEKAVRISRKLGFKV